MAWEVLFVYWNTAIKIKMSVLKIAVSSYLAKKYYYIFVVHILKKKKKKSAFGDFYCKTKELIFYSITIKETS